MLSRYAQPIETAVLMFPLIAFFFTVPFMLYQYHRYGTILMLRTLVVYSFILYLMCTSFLTILPLPDVDAVAKYTSPCYQLIPFYSLVELVRNQSVNWGDPSTYYKLFVNRDFFQIVFNVLMTVPFGIYLRYYFKMSLKKTVLASFFLSLCFELVQLSGLFFIYPRPYRLADVDDLIANTLGGYLGYLIAPMITRPLPSPERMNEVAYRRSSHVSIMRRLCAAMVDCLILFFIASLAFFTAPQVSLGQTTFYQKLLIMFGGYTAFVMLYFGVGEWLMKGRTPGKLFMRIKLVDSVTLKPPKLWQCCVRYGIFYLLVVPAPVVSLMMLMIRTGNDDPRAQTVALIVGLALIFLFICFCVGATILSGMKGHRLPHGYFSRTIDISTLKREKNAEAAGA